MPLGYILARRRHNGCVIAIGECVNDSACGVIEVDTVTSVAQAIANAAIGYEDYGAAVTRKISKEVRASGNHGKASRRQS